MSDIRSQEPVSRVLAAALAGQPADAGLESASNIGPDRESDRPVRDLLEAVCTAWSGRWEDLSDPHAVHEATLLHLDNAKAEAVLGRRPTWAFDRTIGVTVAWAVTAPPSRPRAGRPRASARSGMSRALTRS